MSMVSVPRRRSDCSQLQRICSAKNRSGAACPPGHWENGCRTWWPAGSCCGAARASGGECRRRAARTCRGNKCRRDRRACSRPRRRRGRPCGAGAFFRIDLRGVPGAGDAHAPVAQARTDERGIADGLGFHGRYSQYWRTGQLGGSRFLPRFAEPPAGWRDMALKKPGRIAVDFVEEASRRSTWRADALFPVFHELAGNTQELREKRWLT